MVAVVILVMVAAVVIIRIFNVCEQRLGLHQKCDQPLMPRRSVE